MPMDGGTKEDDATGRSILLPISNFSRIAETFSSGDGGEEEGEARQDEANGITEAGGEERGKISLH